MSDTTLVGEAATAIRGPKRLGLFTQIRAMSDPLAILMETAAKFGDPFVIPTPEAPVLITGDPDAIRAVFTADPDTFDIPYRKQLAPYLGASSLILTSGPRHKKDRKLLMPPFHGERMRTYGKIIVDTAVSAMSKLEPGRPFKMLDVTQAITLDVILHAVFGVDAESRRALFREVVIELMAAMASPTIAMIESLRKDFGGIGPWARLKRASARFDVLLYEEIASRKERSDTRDDILSLMMNARYDDGSAMTDEEIRDQLHLLVFAGHDTTSTALAWAFYWLQRQPQDSARLLAEISACGSDPEPDTVAALPFLDAFCQETLRIHPVVSSTARLLAKPLEVKGNTVTAGTIVSVSILLLHNREDLYAEPLRFRAERFLERKFSPFEFVPFGGGARRCLGAAFAMYEMKLALATVSSRYRLRLASDAPVKCVNRGLTMGPKGGIKMILDGPR